MEEVTGESAPFFLLFLKPSPLLLSSSTRERFYPQRPSGQTMVTGAFPSPPPEKMPSFIPHRVLHPYCSAFFMLVDFHRISLTDALALSARHCSRKKKSWRARVSMDSVSSWTHDLDIRGDEIHLLLLSGTPLNVYGTWHCCIHPGRPHEYDHVKCTASY